MEGSVEVLVLNARRVSGSAYQVKILQTQVLHMLILAVGICKVCLSCHDVSILQGEHEKPWSFHLVWHPRRCLPFRMHFGTSIWDAAFFNQAAGLLTATGKLKQEHG